MASINGTTTEFPNCLYARVSDTGILKLSGKPISSALTGSQSTWVLLLLVDEDLRTILVVAGAKRPRHVARFKQAEAKPIALGLVLFGVRL